MHLNENQTDLSKTPGRNSLFSDSFLLFPCLVFGMNGLESTKCFLGVESVLCIGKSCFWVWWGFFLMYFVVCFVLFCFS